MTAENPTTFFGLIKTYYPKTVGDRIAYIIEIHGKRVPKVGKESYNL